MIQRKTHPFWSVGFRPFFFLAIVQTLVASCCWTLHYLGWLDIEIPVGSNFVWHAATMLYGFVISVFIGFLLTATAKWTNTPPLSGNKLKAFFIFFAIAQVMWFFPMVFPKFVYQAFFLAVYIFLPLFLIRLFLRTKHYRNMFIVIPIGLMCVGAVFMFAQNVATANLWVGLTVGAIRAMLVVISGRVLPFFSKMALDINVQAVNPKAEVFLLLTMMALIFEPLYQYLDPYGSALWLVLTTFALVLNLYRLWKWPIRKSFSIPILSILFIGYLWIPIHFALNIASHLHFVSQLGQPSVHALTYGAMGIMIVAMISRVSLGHTGRKIQATTMMKTAYGIIVFGAFSRVFGPILFPAGYISWIGLTGLMWFVSFALLAIEIFPMLLKPRPDEM